MYSMDGSGLLPISWFGRFTWFAAEIGIFLIVSDLAYRDSRPGNAPGVRAGQISWFFAAFAVAYTLLSVYVASDHGGAFFDNNSPYVPEAIVENTNLGFLMIRLSFVAWFALRCSSSFTKERVFEMKRFYAFYGMAITLLFTATAIIYWDGGVHESLDDPSDGGGTHNASTEFAVSGGIGDDQGALV